MKLALDTNRYVDLMLPVHEVVEIVDVADEIVMPFVVLAELRAGFTNGTRRQENERVLSRFLQKNLVHAVYPDEATVSQYASLCADLLRRGRMITQNDLWIAAL